jgi:type I restriction enzyme S subunit
MSWKKVKLGQFLKVRDNRFKPNDKAIADLKRIDKIDFSGEIFISDKPSNTDMILIKKGDLVISGINVEKGAMAVYTGEEDITATIHYSSYSFDENTTDIEFLKSFLKSIEFKNALKEQVPGGIKTEIKPKHLLPLIVEIPTDIKDQRAVVKLLQSRNTKVDTISSEVNHQLDLIKKLRQQLLQDAVQGKLVEQNPKDEPASELLKKIKAEKEKLIGEKRLKNEKELPPIKPEEIPFEIPENWVWCRLGDLCTELLGGYAFDSTRYSKAETSNQVIRLGNVKPNQLVLETTPVYIDDDYANEAIRAKLFEGDILITMTGTRAKRDYLFTLCLTQSDIETKTLFLNQRVGCFRFGSFIANNYINVILKDQRLLQAVFDSSTGAANQANIGIAALKEILTPIPPLAEQKRIVQKQDELLLYCRDLEANIKQSESQNEKLLQQVLREALRKEPV